MTNRLSNIASNLSNKFTNKLEELRASSPLNKQELYHTVFPPHISSSLESVYKIFRENPNLFTQPDIADWDREQERIVSRRQVVKLLRSLTIDLEKDPYYFEAVFYSMTSYSIGSVIRWVMTFMLYVKSLVTFGTNEKARYCIQKASTGEHIGCFCLTQLYHGSFNRGMRSQARYDHATKSFIITTNGRQGEKFWVGGLAELANICVFWAQLIVDGKSYGPHPFIVPIRDEQNHSVLPGIQIGDLGPKSGNNMIDNGWMRFDNVKVPVENLLDKVGSINEKGEYVSKLKTNEQRFGIHMSPLSTGRSLFCPASLAMSTSALAIAIRYIVMRKQFSNDPNSEENLLIDYPLTKQRMMVPLAETFVFYFGCFEISKLYSDYSKELSNPGNPTVVQLHAISAALKPISSIFGLETIIKCRQMLGGHGYSSYSRFQRLYHDHDPFSTGEGDNMMLLQQTSKVLIKSIPKGKKWKLIDLDFFSQTLAEPKTTKEGLHDVNNLRLFLQNLLLRQYQEVLEETKRLKVQKSDDLWNELQPHFCNSLAFSFGHYFLFEQARKAICTKEVFKPNQNFLLKCLKAWACSLILKEKYGSINFRIMVEETLIELCEQITPDSVVAIDAIAPPKYVVQSPFMNEEGEGMKEYLNLIMTAKNTFSRVEWYEKLIALKEKNSS